MAKLLTASIVAIAALVIMMDGCGYHRAGMGKSLPPYIETIAVPTFKNTAVHYKVEKRFTQAVMDELLKRGRRLHVTSNPDDADAVMSGDIRRFRASGTILDSQGRTRVYQITIVVAVTIRDMKTRKIIYDNPELTFQSEYELSSDPNTFFDEENPAVDRVARDFAQSLVSTIMEGM
ncbi:MAG: LPS assembly lipoprotein LptE [Blastocatellia bacterium]